MKIEIGYQAFVVMGTSCDVLSEKIFSTIEECIADVEINYPQFISYYGIDKIKNDDGFITVLERVKNFTRCYIEDFEE